MQLKDKMGSREFWKYFFVAIGTISSVVTLISFVFNVKNPSCWLIISYVFIVLLLSIAFAIWQTWRKTSLNIKISNNLTVNVNEGDIFDYAKDGNYVVIPVNEYFDTIVDDKIINSGTVHGQFIRRYYPGDNHLLLHEETEAYFKNNNIDGIGTVRPRSEGYTKKYPLGVCAIIEKENTHFVLLALTHFDDDDHAYVELSEFGRCVSHLCRKLRDVVGSSPIYMPLMGMGMARLNQPAQFILKYTLDTIVGIKDLALLGGINIVVYPPVARTLNLNEIKY
jgi:hypothetical protein